MTETVAIRTSMISRGLAAFMSLPTYFPGVLASLIIAIAATFLSEHYGGPVMLFALLLGMAFYFLSQEGRCVAGIELASKHILRVAVGLLGAQITIAEIMKLGPTPVITVVGAVILTILFGALASRAMGLSRRFGILTSGAVAICGASAALAISSVLPKGEQHERDTVFTVIGVTALSTIAMIVYPLVIAGFHLDHAAVGMFLGGTIHDVAQVVGAGFSVSEETGNVATFTKLLRVAMLLPVVVMLSYVFRAHHVGKAGRQLPGFLVVFAVLVMLNSAGVIPAFLLALIKDVSRWCLVTAIAALGMKTSLKAMADVGGRAIALIVAETLFLAVLVLMVVRWKAGIQ
ncbi:YeiH family protein [Bradyrhizobium sp. HKCCYLRH1043]|uniref:YeiH family protein n=2 Tax=unclassified Bradyrhizobium TaxID=2631580 RepID=UPI003966BD80